MSRIEFTLKWSVYWPISGLGTRTWSVAMRCRDPAGQSELFFRVLHLKTFNWMYCYREFIVGIFSDWLTIFCLAVFTVRQIVHWPIYTLNLRVNSNRDTGTAYVTLVSNRVAPLYYIWRFKSRNQGVQIWQCYYIVNTHCIISYLIKHIDYNIRTLLILVLRWR